jgi:SMI1/KNR4 family protein SUKH-1
MDPSWPPMVRRGHEVTLDAVRRFERQFGHELPEDYRRFLLEINGGLTARSHRTFVMERAGRRDETNLNTLFSLDDPDESRDLATWQRYGEDHLLGGLEVGVDGFGSPIVLVLAGPHRGEVWMLDRVDIEEDRPVVEWFDRRDVWKLAGSFAEFMAGLRPLDDDTTGVSAAPGREPHCL